MKKLKSWLKILMFGSAHMAKEGLSENEVSYVDLGDGLMTEVGSLRHKIISGTITPEELFQKSVSEWKSRAGKLGLSDQDLIDLESLVQEELPYTGQGIGYHFVITGSFRGMNLKYDHSSADWGSGCSGCTITLEINGVRVDSESVESFHGYRDFLKTKPTLECVKAHYEKVLRTFSENVQKRNAEMEMQEKRKKYTEKF